MLQKSTNTDGGSAGLERVGEVFLEQDSGSLKDRVYIAVRMAIQHGYLEPDTPLREHDLATVLGVSRTPVRESIQRLEAESLITRVANGGLVVRGVPFEELMEKYRILMVLESYAASLAAASAPVTEIEEMRNDLDLMRFYIERQRWDEATKQGVRFHGRLYESSGNAQLAKLIKELRDTTHAVRRDKATFSVQARLRGLEAHMDILQAVENRNPDSASTLMSEHIANSIERLEGTE